jgi:alkanesulfonate monooxygenase SsuD/methylene tetrahydromethanopterin reductase-like flavin-dependent oxidoreductase (luciferase family)
MKIGVHVVNARPWATAESIVSLGTRAEALGFDSLWVSDQVVIPSELQSSFSYGATSTAVRFFDANGSGGLIPSASAARYHPICPGPTPDPKSTAKPTDGIRKESAKSRG